MIKLRLYIRLMTTRRRAKAYLKAERKIRWLNNVA